MDSLCDELIWEGAHDEKWLEALYTAYKRRMWHIARSILKDAALAEDAVHDTFCRLAQNRRSFQGKDMAEMGRIIAVAVKNTSLNMLRRMKRAVPFPEPGDAREPVSLADDPAVIAEGNEALRQIMAHVAGLDERYRDIVRLKWEFGLKNREIARLLGAKESTVRVWTCRLRQKLAKMIEEDGNHA